MNFPYPVLLCDVGGTNVRFSCVDEPGAGPGPIHHAKTAGSETFAEAVAEVLPKFPVKPRSLIVCAAGPLRGRKVKMTNASWLIDGEDLGRGLGLAQGLLLNDFEAQALSLPTLVPEDYKIIGAFEARRGPQIVLGPGTGLGVAALVEHDGRVLALPSEAAHMDFAPINDEEAALWPHIDTGTIGRVTAEAVLSGSGLFNLHRARLAIIGAPIEVHAADEVTAHALADETSQEAHSIHLFLRLLARFAGDLALTFLAHGGVTFSGGVMPKLTEFLDPIAFREAFEAKAPHQALMQNIGTRIICNEHALLAGMATVAFKPDAYAIDYKARLWC